MISPAKGRRLSPATRLAYHRFSLQTAGAGSWRLAARSTPGPRRRSARASRSRAAVRRRADLPSVSGWSACATASGPQRKDSWTCSRHGRGPMCSKRSWRRPLGSCLHVAPGCLARAGRAAAPRACPLAPATPRPASQAGPRQAAPQPGARPRPRGAAPRRASPLAPPAAADVLSQPAPPSQAR